MVKHSALKGFYELDRTIGCGGFAKVKLATHLATGEKVAIKIMDKAVLKDDLPRVKLELKALKTLSHEHICKLYQVIETESHYFIVVEYCSGGELFDHIVEKNRLNEKESRIFFRQIVSAVAYLHSLGYAHRDLKPENVLLDHAQNLKLIDFGLCARPEGGVQSPLYTSCGSPTYAAPELVLGQEYLGPEVDVWAMGVLLYALLAGFLPFDDQNIDSLYRKILSGKYEEPSFMSSASKRLIRQMLQCEPKKRITVKELMTHPWLTQGYPEPIRVVEENGRSQDEDVVALMAQYHNATKDDMWRHLRRWRYDYDTSTYLLLLARKKRGLPLQLLPGAHKLPIRIRSAETITISKEQINLSIVPPKFINKSDQITNIPKLVKALPTTPQTPVTPRTPMVKVIIDGKCDYSDNENVFYQTVSELLSPDAFVEPRKPSSIRKPLKRIRSPNMDGECSPVPTKRTPGEHLTPKTPERKGTSVGNEGTSVSARKVLGSIERSLHRVKHVLTPRKQSENGQGPATLANKDLCNVSTTQCTDPEFVITELSKALQKKGIQCERKGFTIRGKMDPNVLHRYGGCSFELEICYLPNLGPNTKPSQSGSTPTKGKQPGTPSKSSRIPSRPNTPSKAAKTPSKPGTPKGSKIPTRNNRNSGEFIVQKVCCDNKVGIRRKRLKGDSWCYKKVCEQVLALTATELRLESTV